MNSHNVQYLLNISIGRGWLLKQFALSADSFNTSHHKLPLFQLTPIIHVRFWQYYSAEYEYTIQPTIRSK